MATHNELGKRGEEYARQYLIDNGYKILEINWRSGRYEIDIIAQKFDFLSFVEVKTRSNNDFGYPESFIDRKKMQNTIFAAREYMQEKKFDNGVRYEVISLTKDGGGFQLEHFDEAFTADMAFGHDFYWR